MPRLTIEMPTELGTRGQRRSGEEDTRRRAYARADEGEEELEPAVVRWLSCWATPAEC